MAIRPRLKPEIRYFQTKKLRDYQLIGISESAFKHALNGKVITPYTAYKVFEILKVPETRRESLIEWIRVDSKTKESVSMI